MLVLLRRLLSVLTSNSLVLRTLQRRPTHLDEDLGVDLHTSTAQRTGLYFSTITVNLLLESMTMSLFSAVVTKECLIDKPAKTITTLAVSSCLKLIQRTATNHHQLFSYFLLLQGSPAYCLHYHLENVRDEALHVEVDENSFIGSHTD